MSKGGGDWFCDPLGDRLPKETTGAVCDEVGVPPVDGEVATPVTHFGSHTVLAGHVTLRVSAAVVGDKDSLARTTFQPDQLFTIAVDGDAVQTAARRHQGGS